MCVCEEGGGDMYKLHDYDLTKNPYVCVKRRTFCSYAKKSKNKTTEAHNVLYQIPLPPEQQHLL